ncbi:AB hydrolase-1 domain-containing protein [Mycena indigotica]|uniref:AB hydrolase-1 domain-containing protein n=1 Tax=Mycena indigotica TaxID=2126181 RepID=A0A8H6VTQ3_9AGAR|nr:AB hydrolase-1 domain-containing protein [Mycena indigotica]KAF7289743.1 AB hydrolase-1 domain-containing protein [Mycena indigotica]
MITSEALSMHTDHLVFNSPQSVRDAPGRWLRMAVKRYSLSQSKQAGSGITLFFAHCVGAHKEQWDPTIQRVLELQQSIDEAYAFDWQTHGDSAVLNRELLDPEKSPGRVYGVSVLEWAEAIAAFASSSAMRGRRIVAVGHSAGAGAMILSTKYLTSPSVYEAIIAIEPTAISHEMFYQEIDIRMSTMEFVVSATLTRRETWRTREDAFAWMRKRIPWSDWDERVLQKLVDDGLEATPEGVRVKGDRRQEALCYPEPQPHFETAALLANKSISSKVHFIWADSEAPLVPLFVQDALVVGAASTSKVQGGHMLVQEKPDELAVAISTILANRIGCISFRPQVSIIT